MISWMRQTFSFRDNSSNHWMSLPRLSTWLERVWHVYKSLRRQRSSSLKWERPPCPGTKISCYTSVKQSLQSTLAFFILNSETDRLANTRVLDLAEFNFPWKQSCLVVLLRWTLYSKVPLHLSALALESQNTRSTFTHISTLLPHIHVEDLQRCTHLRECENQ